MSRKAFTLIELLVVIAIIALLLSILMPSLRNAKLQATAAVCMSNQKQLTAAWFMYATENNDKLVDGAPRVSGTIEWEGLTNLTFVAEPQNESGTSFRNNSLEDKIRGFEKGGLWPYYENHKLMNCPSDKRSNHPPVRNFSGNNKIGGYRSYSIGAVYSLIGLYYVPMTGEDREVVTKFTKISQPSTKMVWIEEADGRGHNQNTWNMFLNYERWWDPFAV